MFDTNPDRPTNKILEEIKIGAIQATNNQGGNHVGAILAPFAALMVNLSRESAETAETINELTKRLYRWTVFIVFLTALTLVLTAGMFAIAFVDFIQKH